jgi:hypothetical protein
MADQADRDDSTFVSRRLEATHHPAEIVFGVLAFGFAAFLLIQIPTQTSWVKGAPFVAQPAFWPIVAIVGMTVFGAAELWFSGRRNRAGRRGQIPAEVLQWARALEYVLWFMAYVRAVPLVGYLPATILFCVGLTLRLGYRAPRTLAAAALTGTVTVVVFKAFLSVRIPGGAAYEYLPAALRNFMILYL